MLNASPFANKSLSRRKCISQIPSLFGFPNKGKATFSDFNPLKCKESGRRGIRHASKTVSHVALLLAT